MSQVVGRDAECAVLRGCLTAPGSRPGTIVLVAGEAGAGKTALVEQVLATTATRVLCGRAAMWAPRAYGVLARALRPVLRAAGGPAPGLLAQIIPELGAPPPEPDPAALAAAVCSVLAGVAGDRHVSLFLDDLQWADEATVDLLPALADACGGLPVSVIGSYRSDELPRGHRLQSVRALLRRDGQLTEIGLAPLCDEDVTRMMTALLGAAPQPALAAAVAGRADGLPFAVQELTFALRDGGHLAYSHGTVTLAGPGPAPVPDGIREAVLLRAARLTGEERALVDAAAVAGNEFDIDIVVAASGVAAWPDGFTGSGLLADSGDGRSAFRHPLTREAAYADIPWSRRRRLHRAIASTLTADGGPPALIAVHLLAARDFGPARGALAAAAEQHIAVHAYRDAARALRRALDGWPPGEEDEARLLAIDRLARCAEMCAEYPYAVVLLRELADGHQRRGDHRALAAAQRRLALAHELCGQWESALAAREAAALAFSAGGWPGEAAIDRLAVAAHLRSAASYSTALATLDAVREDAQSAGRLDLLLRAEGLRGNVLSRLGRSREGITTVRAALDQALAGSLSGTAAELQQRLADAIEHSGDYRAAKTAYAAAYRYCDAHGANDLGELCRACATAVLFSCGEWDRAAGVCEDVLASEVPAHARAASAGILGLIHALRGAGLARPLLLESNLAATRIELTAVELLSSWGLCILDDAAGGHDAAVARARQILSRHARTQERHYSVAILQWLASFFAGHRLGADAQTCAAVLADIAETTGQPEAVAALTHARGETLLAAEPEAAARELCRAAGLFGQLDLPLETAQAQHRAATVALQLGERARARELLDAAYATAGSLGARQLREDCAAVLSDLGGKPRQRASAHRAVAGLTGREMDVMVLVAEGNTSRKIGEALFISPRTVEMHVQSSLLKLRSRTRAEAVRRLAELEALPGPGPGPRRAPPRQ